MMKNLRHGFSLIELMIALTIGSFITVGAVSVYSSTRQANRIQAMQSRLSEDGRFALAMLRRVISQAGFRPSPADAIDTTRLSELGSTSMIVKFKSDGTNTMSCGGGVAAANSDVVSKLSFDTTNKKLSCLTLDAAGATTSTDDWITPATDGNGTELISGAFAYGVDTASATTNADYQCGATDRDCVADSYSSSVIATQQERVVAVQVCFVLRSEKKDAGIVKSAVVKDCNGSTITGSDTDNKLYRTFRSTILVRNR